VELNLGLPVVQGKIDHILAHVHNQEKESNGIKETEGVTQM
jgi:hypothetical protein